MAKWEYEQNPNEGSTPIVAIILTILISGWIVWKFFLVN
jgi:hypothetical protein